MGDFFDVSTYPDFARGMRISDCGQHKKAGGLIVDLGWVETGCVSSMCCPSILGLEPIRRMMVQDDCSLDMFSEGNPE